VDIRRLLFTLRHHLWFVLALTMVSLAAFLLIPRLGKTTVYVSSAKILLTPSQSVGADQYRGYDPSSWLNNEQTLRELVTSERLLSRMVQATGLRIPWQQLSERVTLSPLSTEYGRRVNLFLLSVQDESPEQAKKLAEAAVQEFTSYVEELSAREFAGTRRFLEELVAEAKEKVNDTEESLLKITTSQKGTGPSEAASESLVGLDAERRKAKEDISVLEAELNSVQSFLSGRSSISPASLQQQPDASISQLEQAVAAARLKMLELEQLYTQENIQVQEQRAKLQKMQSLYQTKINEFASAVGQDKSLALASKRKHLKSIEDRIQELQNQQLSPLEKRQVAKLERQLAMWEENHLSLVKQLYQARVQEQSSRRQGSISVLENPGRGMLARQKKSRTLAAQLALGVPFSLAFAVTVVVALDLLASSMRLVPKIESSLGVQMLAVIPPVDEDIAELWESFKEDSTTPLNLELLVIAPSGRPDNEVSSDHQA